MTSTVELPLWFFILIVLFAAVTFASHFLFPSVRWFFRRRLERVVARLNARLERPIQPFKLAHRHDMIQRLIYDPEVAQAIVDHAQDMDIPENVAFEQAKRYAREIVPSFSATAYFGFAIRIARWLGTALYRVRLDQRGDEALSTIDPEATVVFVMNHRSNVDYVLVTYLAADRSALSYAVGEWARVWPLSRLIQAMGAYFIRRESSNDLYRTVLARYVRMATRAGVAQAVFPEGGLSLSGALMPPKLGLLKYLTDGFDPDGRDVVFVPVGLNYDRVLEDQVLISAAQDPERRFRAGVVRVFRAVLRLLWRRLIGRYHRFGYAAVSYGEPVSLRAFLADGSKSVSRHLPRHLARELMRRIGGAVPVLPVPMVAWLILGHGPMTRSEVEIALGNLAASLPEANVHLPRGNRDYAAEYGLRNLVGRDVLTLTDGVYAANPKHEETLKFYANSIRHLVPGHDPQVSAGAKQLSAPAGS